MRRAAARPAGRDIAGYLGRRAPKTAHIHISNGAPGRTRTCDPKLRRLVLYPAELRAPTPFLSRTP